MSKYIIRNCPAILRMTKICDAYETTRDLPKLCQDCTDCVLKQIVELCKSENEFYNNKVYKKDVDLGRTITASNVLQLLDIKDIE